MPAPCQDFIPPGSLICGGTHCDNYIYTSVAERICKCIAPDGHRVPDCTPKTDKYPIETATCYNKATNEWRNISDDACQDLRNGDKNWSWKTSYCCCPPGDGSGAQILVGPGESRPVAAIAAGDPVMAATLTLTDAGPALAWRARAVAFVEATAPAEGAAAVRLTWGADSALTCPGDQPFVRPDGRTVAARALRAGDAVLDAEARPVALTGAETVAGGVVLWHLATDASGPDGHLVALDGLLAGDFVARQTLGGDADAGEAGPATPH